MVVVDCSLISDWDTLHDVFADALGFPEYYGRNSSAWIDCMTWPNEECSSVTLAGEETFTVHLKDAQTLKERAPQFADSHSGNVSFRELPTCRDW